MRPLLLAALLPLTFLAGPGGAADREEITPMHCEAPAVCRPAGSTTITLQDGSSAPIRRTDPTAYVSGDVVTLMPGEVITLKMTADNEGKYRLQLVSVAAADMQALAPFVEAHLKAMQGGADANNMYAVRDAPRFDTPPDVIRLTFIQAPGRGDSLLIVEDGYDGWLRYHAFMVTPRGASATDVCDVQAPRYGVEHWPHPILVLQLSRLDLIAPQFDAGGRPVIHCE